MSCERDGWIAAHPFAFGLLACGIYLRMDSAEDTVPIQSSARNDSYRPSCLCACVQATDPGAALRADSEVRFQAHTF